MKPLKTLLANAAMSNRKVVLSEGADPRVVQAALDARSQNVAEIVLVGAEAAIRAQLAQLGGHDVDGIEIHDPMTSPLLEEYAHAYCSQRKHKGVTLDEALAAARDPHIFAALMVKVGHADGTVGGATIPTADVVRTALQVIGTAPDARFVSSFFLMLFCADHHEKKGAHIFADAGLVVNPSAEELAQIACSSADSLTSLVSEVPRVAMLSFSTKGSAKHESVSKVVEATNIAKRNRPDLLIDGELQFDAAFVPDVASAKARHSPVAGDANVFVFPNLDSGNIGYKIAQRIGGAVAIGPILQGLAKPANDLSRGCSSEDILHLIAVTTAQAESNTPARPAAGAPQGGGSSAC